MAAAAARHRNVVVAVMCGSAVLMPWVDSVASTLVIWYPGVDGGGAFADVLVGRSEPGGRLPFAVPTDSEHLVEFDRNATAVTYDLFHGQWKLDRDGNAAQFPFGWGLGYGSAQIEAASSPMTADRYGSNCRTRADGTRRRWCSCTPDSPGAGTNGRSVDSSASGASGSPRVLGRPEWSISTGRCSIFGSTASGSRSPARMTSRSASTPTIRRHII